jgi:hypothetical protein
VLRGWWHRWKKTSLPNKLGIILSAVAIGLSSFNVWLFRRQVLDQDKQVAQITGAINNGIGTAKTAIEGVLTQNREATIIALTENRESLTKSLAATHADNQARLKATLTQGEKSLNASINASQLDQRAWVGLKSMRMVTLEQGKPITVEGVFTNTGKTFALDSTIEFTLKPNIGPLNIDQFAVSSERRHPDLITRATMFPNFDMSLSVPTAVNATEKDIELIKEGKLLVYAIGEVRYSDIFKRRHETLVCGVYSPALSKFNICEQYNRAD